MRRATSTVEELCHPANACVIDEQSPLLSVQELSNNRPTRNAFRRSYRSQSSGNLSLSGSQRDGVGTRRPFYISPYEDQTRPYSYHRVPSMSNIEHATMETHATLSRYKYYSKLAPGPPSEHTLTIPDHVLPPQFFAVIPITGKEKQSSIVIIFSIWNTMMGTSLLSMPWALQQAGFTLGLFLMVSMAAISFYTCYRVLQSTQQHDSEREIVEFSDVCQSYMGRIGAWFSVVFGLACFLGALVVYWVLMTNFLYHTVNFAYDKYYDLNETLYISDQGVYGCGNAACHSASSSQTPPTYGSYLTPTTSNSEVLPLSLTLFNSSESYSFTSLAMNTLSPNRNSTPLIVVPANYETYRKIWDQVKTVPFFLMLILVPLINFKSPTFFTKFNSLGTVSVGFLVIFIIIKLAVCGIDFDFADFPHASGMFPALTGTMSLAYFIHPAITSIVRNQAKPENSARDLGIAYILVALTYIFVATMFYVYFPLDKGCIRDNFFDNFQSQDVLTFIARVFFLFQMTTVFPLIAYIFRLQFMHAVFGNIYPSLCHVLVLNAVLVVICILFAVFLPSIGTIIRFTGAFSGLAYMFALPSVVYMLSVQQQGKLSNSCIIIHSIIIILGLANFAAQFVILGDFSS